MRLRRKTDIDRVRFFARNVPSLSADLGKDVVRLRRAMRRASVQIGAGAPEAARRTLREALEERWW